MRDSITRTIKATLCATALLTPVAGRAEPTEEIGREARAALDIPAQSLDNALLELSRQAAVQFLISGSLPAHTTPRVSGTLSVAEALAVLLTGTQVTYKWVGEHTIAVGPHVNEGTAPAENRDTSGKTPLALEEVLVTGSHLRSGNTTTVVASFDRNDINRLGASNVGDVLSYLPQQSFQLSESTSFAGSRAVQLRGLGLGTTLVLINGRRTVTSALEGARNFFDLNSIPLAAVERVEVLSESASAVYGADAVGGVVNILLKRDIERPTVDVYYGHARGGGDERRVSLAGGYESERVHASAVVDGFWRQELTGAQRPWLADRDYRRFGSTDARLPLGRPGNVYSLSGANLPGLPSDHAAIPVGTGIGLTPADFVAGAGQENRDSFSEYAPVLPESERYSALGTLDFEIADSLSAFVEALYINRDDTTINTPPYLFFGVVPAANPFNPFGADVQVNYFFTELDPRIDTSKAETFRTVGGLRGSLGVWDWEASVLRTDETASNRTDRQLDAAAAAVALAQTDPVLALNVFGSAAAGSSAVLSSILLEPPVDRYESKALQGVAFIRGSLYTLASGDIEAVLGGEVREETLVFDAPNSQIDIAPNRHASAAYAELRIPFFGGEHRAPGLDALELTVAGRYDHYNDFGSTFNPQYGIRWRPVPQLMIRAAHGKSYRAPSLFELYYAPVATSAVILDSTRNNEPVSVTFSDGGNPALRPEKADSSTVGFVLTPHESRALRFAVSYWDVHQDSRVQRFDYQTLLNNEALFSDRIVREPRTPADIAAGLPGRLVSINSTSVNYGSLDTSGIDTQLSMKLVDFLRDLFTGARCDLGRGVSRAGLSKCPRNEPGQSRAVERHHPALAGDRRCGMGARRRDLVDDCPLHARIRGYVLRRAEREDGSLANAGGSARRHRLRRGTGGGLALDAGSLRPPGCGESFQYDAPILRSHTEWRRPFAGGSAPALHLHRAHQNVLITGKARMRIALRSLAAVLVMGLVVRAHAAESAARMMIVDDVFAMEGLGGIWGGGGYLFSPRDGALAVVRQRPWSTRLHHRVDGLYDGDISDVWVQSAPGAPLNNLTHGAADHSGWFAPQWSPDGKHIAMLSTRGDTTTLWVADEGKPPRQLTTRGVELVYTFTPAYQWLDETHIVAVLLPENAQPYWMRLADEAAKVAAPAWEKADRGLEPTASVIDNGENAPSQRAGTELIVIDVMSGRARSLSSGMNLRAVTLSPDRRFIAFCAEAVQNKPRAGERLAAGGPATDMFSRYTVRIVSVDGKVHFTAEHFARDVLTQSLRWAPDSSEVAFLGYEASRDEAPLLYRARRDSQKVDVSGLRGLDATPATDVRFPEIEWTYGKALFIRAARRVNDTRPADGDRWDWWLVRANAEPKSITSALHTPPDQLWAEPGRGTFVGVADRKLYRVAISGAVTQISRPDTPPIAGLAWPARGLDVGTGWQRPDATYSNVILELQPQTRGVEYALIDLASRELRTLAKPSENATLTGYSQERDAALFAASGREGTTLWRQNARGSNEGIVTINAFLREVREGQFRRIDYTSLTGEPLSAWLLLPADYVPGRKYPLITWVYAGSIAGPEPSAMVRVGTRHPYNLQIAAAHGYAVLMPSMPLNAEGGVDDPLLKLQNGVLPAVDAVIRAGFTDADQLFLMGQSYGGYSTFGLLAQTSRFKAAIAMAGISNLSSMYGAFSASWRYMEEGVIGGLWAAELLETRQGRMNNPPWRDPGRYVLNSPLFHVAQVSTPLMIVHGDLDYVPIEQSEEMFTALVRNEQRVRFLRYWGEGHVLDSPANIRDLWSRVFEWFAEFGGPP